MKMKMKMKIINYLIEEKANVLERHSEGAKLDGAVVPLT